MTIDSMRNGLNILILCVLFIFQACSSNERCYCTDPSKEYTYSCYDSNETNYSADACTGAGNIECKVQDGLCEDTSVTFGACAFEDLCEDTLGIECDDTWYFASCSEMAGACNSAWTDDCYDGYDPGDCNEFFQGQSCSTMQGACTDAFGFDCVETTGATCDRYFSAGYACTSSKPTRAVAMSRMVGSDTALPLLEELGLLPATAAQ